MNYTELKSNIAAWLHRTDLTDKIDTFIDLAEGFLFRELNVSELETTVTGTTSGATIAIPADMGTLSKITITHAGREVTLDHATPNHALTSGGVPTQYQMQDGAITLSPVPGDGYPYTLYYTPNIAPLSSTNTTNWLLEKAPDLYLLASQYQGAKYVADFAAMQQLGAEIGPLLDSVQRLTKRRQAVRGTLQIRTR
jgi:hypothetical protein